MEAVREDVASEGAAAGATAGPNVHGVPPTSPDEPLPLSVLVTWAVILLTTAALLRWQSVSYKRAQRRKEELAQEEAKWLEQQQEVRRVKAEQMRLERLAREAVAEEEAAKRRLAAAAAAAEKETALAKSARANAEAAQRELNRELSKGKASAAAEEEARLGRLAARAEAAAANEAARVVGRVEATAAAQQAYAAAAATAARVEFTAAAVAPPGELRSSLTEERGAAVERAEAALSAATAQRDAAAAVARARRVAAAESAGERLVGGNAVLNGVMPQHESDADRAVREGTIDSNADRAVRQQQDEEYRAALAVDRARTEAKQAEEARLAALQERWAVMEEPAPGADGCVRVLVRLPNGQRLQRRFHATMPLRELFDFVEVSWQPAKGVHSAAQYSLVADFPKRTYRRDVVSESGATFQDEGMGPQQAFFIAWE